MTVINTSYSSIEEAWADSYLSPSLQKKPKKKRQDPICDLYNARDSAYDDTDIIAYANKFYDKSQFQKPMNREPPRKEITVGVEEPPSEEYEELPPPHAHPETRLYNAREDYENYEKTPNLDYFDIALYVISGIILIFMMEQFVKIGMLLSRS